MEKLHLHQECDWVFFLLSDLNISIVWAKDSSVNSCTSSMGLLGPYALCDKENRDSLCLVLVTGDCPQPYAVGNYVSSCYWTLIKLDLRGPEICWEFRKVTKRNSYFKPIKDKTNTLLHSSESAMPHLSFQIYELYSMNSWFLDSFYTQIRPWFIFKTLAM